MDAQKQPNATAYIAGLTFSLFNCVTMMLSAGGSLFGTLASFGKSDAFFAFAIPGLLAALVCGVAFMLASHWGIVASATTKRRWAAALAAVGAAAFAGLLIAPQSLAFALASIAGIAAAFSYILQFMAWGTRLSRVGFKRALASVALASAISGACALALFEFCNAAIMAGAYCVALIAGGIASWTPGDEDCDRVDEPVPPEKRRLSLNRELWPLFAGSLLCMFTILLMWQGADDYQVRPASASITQGMFVGFIACAAALAAIARMHPSDAKLRHTLITLCPLFAALPIVPCIASIEPDSISGLALGMLTGVGFSYFMGIPVAAFCINSAADKNAQGVWGMASVALSVGGVFGLAAANALDGAQTTPLTLALFVGYLVACAIVPKSKAQGEAKSSPENAEDNAGSQTGGQASAAGPEAQPAEPGDPLQARCNQLADKWNLTPREREVLPLLAQGRTQPSIARELYCSRETVKVHVRHIYEKAGVHSKDALLDIVHE